MVEDEADLGGVVRQYLEFKGFDVDWCIDGGEALDKIRVEGRGYDALLIDVSLNGMDGFELAEQIALSGSDAPFLFLTARNERQDRLRGLNLGADDYVVKPFDIDELVLRIRNIIRRRRPAAPAPQPVPEASLPAALQGAPQGTPHAAPGNFVQLHDVGIDRDLNNLVIKGEVTVLTTREAELLLFLFRNPNRILKREEILLELWGHSDFFLGRSLDVFVSRLRKYLGKSEKVSIKNVYGIGFIFSC